MPEENGDYRKILQDLVEESLRNIEEHKRIWSAIDKLRDLQVNLTAQISSLTSAMRDLIDRIPPENLR